MLILLQQQQPSWCPMCPEMGQWGWLGSVVMGLLLILVLVVLIWLLHRLVTAGGRSGGAAGGRAAGEGDRAMEVLRERYAKGEIDEETYERMRRNLQ